MGNHKISGFKQSTWELLVFRYSSIQILMTKHIHHGYNFIAVTSPQKILAIMWKIDSLTAKVIAEHSKY